MVNRFLIPLAILALALFDRSAASSASREVVYATTSAGVAEYDPFTGQQIGLLPLSDTVLTSGLAVHGGTIFVGEYSANPDPYVVAEFPRGAVSPARYAAPNQEFGKIAVSAKGELAVAGLGGGSCCSTSTLTFFAAGETKPNRTFVRNAGSFNYVAYDAAGTCWVEGIDANEDLTFGYVAAGTTKLVTVAFPAARGGGPIAIDASGNIVLAAVSGELQVFSPAGALLARTRLRGTATVTGIAVSADGASLYVSNLYSRLSSYRYPGGEIPLAYFGTYANSIAVAK